MTPRLDKAVLAGVLGLTLYTGLIVWWRGAWTTIALLNTAFYLLLLANSYFSITFTEAVYKVRCASDGLLSSVLVIGYLLLPWTVDRARWFYLLMALFFCLAVLKYANWLSRLEANFFLRRKIMANTCGAAECLLTTAALAWFEAELTVVSVAVALYAYGNLHTLLIDPLYRER
ncbi:MAG: hypothetical protein IID40_02350 [Planctomycetes bacterium]|nr:hypothetical protein [Planctomycetota bacterium]